MVELFDGTVGMVERGVSNTIKAQEVIAQNIANANTPGYVPKEFSAELGKAIEKQEQKGVVLEEEMAAMAKNSDIIYKIVSF